MKLLGYIILTLLGLMSFAAGIAKVLATPQEVAFFESAGVSESWLLPLGILQITAAIAAAVPRTRRIGLIAIAIGFAISSIIIFMTGNTSFGLVSLVPVILALMLGWKIQTN